MSFISNYPEFRNLPEAFTYMDISDNSEYILIEEHPESLERIVQGGRAIYIIGKGLMNLPGRPGGNQDFSNQLPFFYDVKLGTNLFPIFYSSLNGRVRFVGTYTFVDYVKKISPAGFGYYEFKFYRIFRDHIQHIEPQSVRID
jgi:hypothetical protein